MLASKRTGKPGTAQKAKLMGVVHKAAKALQMDDEARRVMMVRVTGKRSLSDMSLSQIGAVLDEMRALGWNDGKHAPAGRRRLANHAEATKIRALWLSLYHLGEARDPSEDALAAFVKRQTRLDDLQWVKQEYAYQVIEALKSWCTRAGYEMPDAQARNNINRWRENTKLPGASNGHCCKIVLIQRQWRLLIELNAFRHGIHADLGGYLARKGGVSAPWFLDANSADKVIEDLGAWIRKLKPQAEHD